MSNQYKKPVIKIQHEKPPTKKGWLFLLFSVLLGVLAGGYYLGASNNGQLNILPAKVSLEDKQDGNTQNSALQPLKDENKELIAQLAKLERMAAIDKTASVNTQKGLVEKENEIKTLKEELSFYKSIISPEQGETGLTIHSFDLAKGGAEDLKQFHLVLTQIAGGGKEAKGTVIFRLQGKLDGVDKLLEWWDIRSDNSQQMPSFKFKYFQRIKGALKVPKGFIPDNILVKVIPEDTKLNSAQQSYSWDAVFKDSNKRGQ